MPTIETLFVGTCKDVRLLVVFSPPLHIIILLLPFSVLVSGCCDGYFPRYYLPTCQQSTTHYMTYDVKKKHQKLQCWQHLGHVGLTSWDDTKKCLQN
jgi:hypothetical protein